MGNDVWSKDVQGRYQRLQEAIVIEEKMKNLMSEDKNEFYMITGDFNDIPTSETMKTFLKDEEFLVKVPAADTQGATCTILEHGDEECSAFDHILVSPKLFSLIKNEKASIVDLEEMSQASDHRMVYMDIEI